MTKKNELRLMLNQDVVNKLLDDNPAVIPQITDNIIKKTSKMIIKKALNDRDLIDEVKVNVDKAVARTIEDFCVKIKEKGFSRTPFVTLTPELKDLITPKIEQLLLIEAEKIFEEHEILEKIIANKVTIILDDFLSNDYFQKKLEIKIDAIASKILRKKLNLDMV